MFRYLHAAFWVRERLPFLGPLPVNVLAMAAFLTLGFGHPAFWLLGLLGETAYLWAMTSSERFRKIVDALEWQTENENGNERQKALVEKLNEEHRHRREQLHEQLTEVRQAYEEFAGEDVTAQGNLSSLRELDAAYAKLLLARQHLMESNQRTKNSAIENDVRELEEELTNEGLSSTARSSKEATLELLQKRLEAARQRVETLVEIESDLERIEAQFNLAVDSAAMRSKPEDLHVDVDLTSRLISTSELVARRLEE